MSPSALLPHTAAATVRSDPIAISLRLSLRSLLSQDAHFAIEVRKLGLKDMIKQTVGPLMEAHAKYAR